MTERDFCYWLKGYLELTKEDSLTKDQLEVIQERLDLVFKKETKKVVDKQFEDEALRKLKEIAEKFPKLQQQPVYIPEIKPSINPVCTCGSSITQNCPLHSYRITCSKLEV